MRGALGAAGRGLLLGGLAGLTALGGGLETVEDAEFFTALGCSAASGCEAAAGLLPPNVPFFAVTFARADAADSGLCGTKKAPAPRELRLGSVRAHASSTLLRAERTALNARRRTSASEDPGAASPIPVLQVYGDRYEVSLPDAARSR